MPLWVIPLFFGIYFLLGTMIARLRAEMGFLCHDFQNSVDPHHMIIDAFGTRRLGAGAAHRFYVVYALHLCKQNQPDAAVAGSLQDFGTAKYQSSPHRCRYCNRNIRRSGRNILALVGQLLSTRCRVGILHGTDHRTRLDL